MAERLRVAVVGGGVAGLTAAYIARRHHEVTLFEKDARLGGHAHTHSVATADGRSLALDTGFLVHNNRTYPSLLRLFAELGVQTQASTMSFGVRCDGCGLEYSGAHGVSALAPHVGRGSRLAYVRMLLDVRRFHVLGHALLQGRRDDSITLGEFVDRGGYTQYFRDHFLLPLGGAVWSSSPSRMLSFPARYLLNFFANHGMLGVGKVPHWQTVVGGSRSYVERIGAALAPRVLAGQGVSSITRDPAGVTIATEDGRERRFDRVVIAAHPDQALAILADPSEDETRVLGSFTYSTNDTVLHTDRSLLPRTRRARSSWNYLLDTCATERSLVNVTYHLNRLQALEEPLDYCVTLNQTARIDPSAVLARMSYAHPVYTREALAAQQELVALDGVRRTHFCGAYHGWGFHEDGCASGVRAAAALGAVW